VQSGAFGERSLVAWCLVLLLDGGEERMKTLP
jgi:hypothetical protein